jgi:NADH-quinone oxidoreductase subunit I
MGIIKVERPPKDPSIFHAAWGYISTISGGMQVTLKIFLKQLLRREKTQTLEWPEAPATYSDRFKGKHFLTKRPDGQVRCTACFLCATACPAQCIYIEAGQHPDNATEKFPVRFEIDILRCVFCGYCEEACPVDAIRLGPEFAMADTDEKKWVYTKDYLVNRPELHGGITSIKEENVKHPSITHEPTANERKSIVKFGHH